jgi:hypothetical protein
MSSKLPKVHRGEISPDTLRAYAEILERALRDGLAVSGKRRKEPHKED